MRFLSFIDAYDMRASHGIERIAYMTLPYRSKKAVKRMYIEGFEQNHDPDYLLMPLVGFTHHAVKSNPYLRPTSAINGLKK